MSLATYDLFTDEEFELYSNIIQLINEQDGINNLPKEEKKANKARIKELAAKKRELSDNLNALIKQHLGTPRTVRLLNVLDTRKIRDENGEVHTPPGISWHTLRLSKKIAEFESEESRAMGLCQDEITFDKIILKWKFIDVLEQVVKDGFYVPILNPDGSVTQKKYRCHTASAGQLRTDKVQFLSEEIWERIHKQLECGMDHEKINSHGGINCNKLLAYEALVSSATDVWDFDIDRCLVIEDFEAEVTGAMKYIKPDYSYEVGEKTVLINHGDGIGMMLPCVSIANFMVRGPYLKGLLSSFDYIRFCKVRGVEAVIKDVWGLEHDLIKENIQVLFTKSQLKLWKYYDSWEHYKKCFKENGCHLCRTNYEEKWIPDTYINYQMLQTLQDFTDEEVRQFTKREHDRIESLAKNKETMLRVLNAEMDSDDPYREALYLYPALLREAYSRESLKDVKRKMLLDARSGKIKCKNKRLFAIPDFYAACEFWFLGDKHPKGLLKDGEIACKIYQDHDEADVLRSPH